MEWKAQWIKPVVDFGDVPPVFITEFKEKKEIKKAIMYITAMGVYDCLLNGKHVGEFVMAPGWTSYYTRLQYQEYDVTDMLRNENCWEVTVGKGWYQSPMPWQCFDFQIGLRKRPGGLLAQLEIEYADGSVRIVSTDESWRVSEGPVRFAEIYDGEVYDARVTPMLEGAVEIFDGPFESLIPQEGEEIREQEHILPAAMFTTSKGEVVLDFGQNMTGYVEVSLYAQAGEVVDLSFAEVMDKDGNFYNENYRGAKCQYHYTCCEGLQTYHPSLTFYGFRYIRINTFPGGANQAKLSNFKAIVIHSDMKRTGYLSCSNPMLNQLFSNVVWGQKSNFVDVPTDCPQRDERLGWTGDAQVFVKTAAYNYDVEKFFTKWLADLAADQYENGGVAHVVPDVLQRPKASAAWGDAATICPWEIYMAYGNPQILRNQYESMKSWIKYITDNTEDRFLWTGGSHYGDWLGIDSPSGSLKGASDDDFIASAFYAYSTRLVVKAGKILGESVEGYEELYQNILNAFQNKYNVYHTQTECVVAAHFGLAKDCQAVVDQLAKMIIDCGVQLKTGFVGTPYLLHVLSDYGYAELAYSLLLRKEYPSWLYPVTKGATTIWEHWDGIMEDGSFWRADMNSYNHYAYGSVMDWVYDTAAGIRPIEEAPGYAKVKIAPTPDKRLEWLNAELNTRHGRIVSSWKKEGNYWRYEITTPVEAEIVIAGKSLNVKAGTYHMYSII